MEKSNHNTYDNSLFILDIVNEQLETIDSDYNIYPKKTEEKFQIFLTGSKKTAAFMY